MLLFLDVFAQISTRKIKTKTVWSIWDLLSKGRSSMYSKEMWSRERMGVLYFEPTVTYLQVTRPQCAHHCYWYPSNPAWKCLTQNNNVGPKQGYNHAKFERCCFNDVREKAKVKVVFFFKWGNMSIISLQYVWLSKKVTHSWSTRPN